MPAPGCPAGHPRPDSPRAGKADSQKEGPGPSSARSITSPSLDGRTVTADSLGCNQSRVRAVSAQAFSASSILEAGSGQPSCPHPGVEAMPAPSARPSAEFVYRSDSSPTVSEAGRVFTRSNRQVQPANHERQQKTALLQAARCWSPPMVLRAEPLAGSPASKDIKKQRKMA